MLTILLVVLLVLALGGLPQFGYTSGYGPSGLFGIVIVLLLVWLLFGGRF